MGNAQSIDTGRIDQLHQAVQQTRVDVQALQEQMNVQEQEIIKKAIAPQGLLEKINARVVVPAALVLALVGGGTILFFYIRKKKVSASKVSVLLPEPWRTIHPKETDLSRIKESCLSEIVKISTHQDTKLNILLLGQAGSGKSSFINSCITALKQSGRIIKSAAVLEGSSGSVSKHLQAYDSKVRDGDGKVQLPVRVFDCRGLLDENRGVQTNDIINICDGHVKDKYEIQPKTPITPEDPEYRANPTEKDKIHCVVYVIEAQNGDKFVRETVKKQFEEVKNHLLKSGISTPQLILLTKIDRLGVRHIDKIFYDKRVEECCEKVSSIFGFPLGDVLPQANYCKEVHPTDDRDSITIFNILTIIQRAKDHLQRESKKTERVPK